ncbi:Acyl-CoA thioesterase FadM [Aliiroseovarius halocynthiae]|uniref:Thioesterase n=1 Tax=Aliiroseovarius halocynthiae TaxID=985055 RepID=A0A545SNJ1_9RHOB|nr:thioesterase family protein [Aliiroseovarius halocynthiae]TQV66426.1 thioesterase [Aliiroseovarius halocynthiae]SMR83406.1 Acyl-CoA thioesterase FadM [Aliiroseovarius halocynthiae]
MYPFIRMIKEMVKFAKAEPLPVDGIHVSHHRCWPWDIDLWRELNNGRTLTMYDLGRIPLASRTGLSRALLKNRWGLTMAGASVRYRKRIRTFARFEMRSRLVGWDDRFFYVEQTMWLGKDCANQIVYRSAVTDRNGIVPTDKVRIAIGHTGTPPALPDWVQAWIAADATRPWPPEM